MIHTAEIDLDQLAESDAHSKPIELDVWAYWYENGYPVESVLEAHSAVNAKQDDDNTGHIVVKVETLSKPLNRADVVEDTVAIWSCDCRDYQFNQSVDLEETSVTEWSHCKHIIAVDRTLKAANDENQDTIV